MICQAPAFDAVGAEHGADVPIQIRRPAWEVIGVAEGQDRAPVSADQPQPGGDHVQLPEIEGDVEDIVLEPVSERSRAPVIHLPEQEMGPHAAISPGVCASASATS